jgi:hypothetical protein
MTVTWLPVSEKRYSFSAAFWRLKRRAHDPQRVSENDEFGEREARWPEAFRGQDHF